MTTKAEVIFRLRELADALETDKTERGVVGLVGFIPGAIAHLHFAGEKAAETDLLMVLGAVDIVHSSLNVVFCDVCDVNVAREEMEKS